MPRRYRRKNLENEAVFAAFVPEPDHKIKSQCDEMTSVPQRFAGFRSAASVLEDASLTDEQKRTALLSWRASLQQGAPYARDGKPKRTKMLREIDEALEKLGGGTENRANSGWS